jgi:hypothetical protein
MAAMQEGFATVNDNFQHLFDRMDVLERRRRKTICSDSPGEPHPQARVVGTALLFGGTSLPLRLTADLTFRAFMRGTARG